MFFIDAESRGCHSAKEEDKMKIEGEMEKGTYGEKKRMDEGNDSRRGREVMKPNIEVRMG